MTSSRNQCLWGALTIDDKQYYGSCGGGYNISLSIDASACHLSFTFSPTVADHPHVTVSVSGTAFRNGLQLDMNMTLAAASATNETIASLLWLSDLVMDSESVDGVFLPFFPGVVMSPKFFESGTLPTQIYPGRGYFADLVSWTSGPHRVAVFAIPRADNPLGSKLTILKNGEKDWVAHRDVPLSLKENDVITHPTMRMLLGELELDDVAASFRSSLPPSPLLREKLKDKFANFSRQPLVKLDCGTEGVPFSQLPTRVAV